MVYMHAFCYLSKDLKKNKKYTLNINFSYRNLQASYKGEKQWNINLPKLSGLLCIPEGPGISPPNPAKQKQFNNFSP